jgi:hypothetical protein
MLYPKWADVSFLAYLCNVWGFESVLATGNFGVRLGPSLRRGLLTTTLGRVTSNSSSPFSVISAPYDSGATNIVRGARMCCTLRLNASPHAPWLPMNDALAMIPGSNSQGIAHVVIL